MIETRAHLMSEPTLANAVGALLLSLALAGGGLLWLRVGEAVYVERLFTALAGCF